MTDAIRLNGKKRWNGETVEFTLAEVSFVNRKCGDWWIEQGGGEHMIDPASIRLAEDPRKQMLDEIREKVDGITTGPAPVVLSLDDMDAIMSLLDGTQQGVDPIQLKAEIVVDVDYADHDDTPIYTAEHLQVRMDEQPSWVARDDADWIKLVEGMNGLLKKLATSRQHGSAHRAVLQRRLEDDIRLARDRKDEEAADRRKGVEA